MGHDRWKSRSDLDDWAAQNHEPPEERPTFTESEVAAAVEAERAACEELARANIAHSYFPDGSNPAKEIAADIAARKAKP